MHIEQSPVGKVLSSMAIVPPMEESRWIMWTLKPLSARSRAACIPPMPPPAISTDPRLVLFPFFFMLLQLLQEYCAVDEVPVGLQFFRRDVHGRPDDLGNKK